jgi:signal transduction histidine kinase
MDRAEALKQLGSTAPHERLKAAQFFAKHFTQVDLPSLRVARSRESVAYVKRRLDAAIERAEGSNGDIQPPAATAEPDVPEILRKEIRAKAVEWVSGTLLHELEPIIGQLRTAATREIPTFEDSRVKAHLDQLERVCSGISCLRQATATPRIEEFDLAWLIKELIAQEVTNKPLHISVQGQQPFVMSSDPRLLTLAICNGLRNAIEAVESVPEAKGGHPVVISWGMTDVDYWVVILDQGPGIVGVGEGAFNIGTTTKIGHIGFGLAIARQAIGTLEGNVTLSPAQGGGARLELRWDK